MRSWWQGKPGVLSRLAWLLIAVGCGGLPFTTRAADDPSRFLLVTNWFATFTHTLNVNGMHNYVDPNTEDNCTANWRFIHDMTVSCRLIPDPQTLGHPYFRQFLWKQNDAASVHISDKFEWTCIDPEDGSSSYHSYTVDDTGGAPTNFAVQIDTSAQTYSVVWIGAFPSTRGEVRWDDFVIPDNIGIQWSPDALTTSPLPASGMILRGEELISMRDRYLALTPAAGDFIAGDPRFGGMHPLGPSLLNGSLQLTWSLTPQVEQLEVVVEPEGHRYWLPEGNLKEPGRRGNTIKVKAKLQTTGGGEPQTRAESFQFELIHISDEPGVCMNRPIESPSTAPDMQFESELNLPSNNQVTIVQSNLIEVFEFDQDRGITEASVVVSSFDFGAYAEIRVTAKLGERTIVGYLKGDPAKREDIPLPKCAPESHIADIWKERWGVQDLDDEDDNEDVPEGDGHDGDGYTLYEEYRGFSENRGHIRIRPLQKDLFIRNGTGDENATADILLFQKASGLAVHYKLRADEISSVGLMNPNHGHAYSGHPQSGILMKLWPEKRGYSEAVDAAGALPNSTPGSKLFVGVEPEAWGIDLTDGGASQVSYGARVDTIAHEIAHCCAVWHHGDCDLRKRKWVSRTLSDGTRQLEEASPGGSGTILSGICNPDGTPATLVFTVVPGSNLASERTTRHVAVVHGEHSGDTSCIMCYANANAYRLSAPNKRYVANWQPVQRTHFCTSAGGTGVNQPPNSRHGSAHARRGNCRGQICVNDQYKDAREHDRDYDCE